MKKPKCAVTVSFDGGTDVDEAFKEAIQLANRVKVKVEFNFNGVKCIAFPGGSAEKGAENWHDTFHGNKPHKFAFAN